MLVAVAKEKAKTHKHENGRLEMRDVIWTRIYIYTNVGKMHSAALVLSLVSSLVFRHGVELVLGSCNNGMRV